jgi:hypothetical protein
MKGLDLARDYFFTLGLPMLEEAFPEEADAVAAGLAGDGSECFGFDDAYSRDHDWGPGFCLWVPRSLYPQLAPALQTAYQMLPGEFKGYGPRVQSAWGGDRVGVFETEAFYARFTGLDRPPATLEEWLFLPENALAACTNGEVFYDPPGEFTRWREALLAFYPEDARKKKLASRCMTLGQSGQYNFPRCTARGDVFGADYAKTKFMADAVSMVFLLNRAYTPFYKWMHRGLLALPILGQWLHGQIVRIVEERGREEQGRLIEETAAALAEELRRQGLSRSKSGFLADHGPEIQKTIRDPALRARNVWVG